MTLQDVSNASGVDTATLSDFERGMSGLHIDTLKKIADALGIAELSAALAPYVPDPARAEACTAAYIEAMATWQELHWASLSDRSPELLAATAKAKAYARQLREAAPSSGVDPRELDTVWSRTRVCDLRP